MKALECFLFDDEDVNDGDDDTSGDESIKEWSVMNGECLRTLLGHTDWVSSVCLSADGQCLYSGSREMKVWDLKEGSLVWHQLCVIGVCVG